jgi:DNA invertase Pin-like site-specific DNA recombinase
MSTKLTPSTRSKTSLDTLRVIGVARQSRTADESYSVSDQIDALDAACARDAMCLLRVEQEPDTSGQRPLARRHGLLRAVEAIERGEADVLMVAYFDRLARKLAVQNEVVDRVEAAGGSVRTLDHGQISTGSAAEWLSSSVIGLINEYYARSVGQRTHERKVQNVKNGIPHFPRITIAYERITDGPDKGKLKPSQYAPLVREAAQMRLDGKSWETITRFLHEHDVVDPRTKQLVTRSAVISMFKSPLLVGDVHWGGITTRDAHEPIIDRATQSSILAKRATRGRYSKSDRLLARLGVLRCATCDSRMIVSTTTSNGKRYAYYVCGDALCAKKAIVSAPVAEDFVRDETIRLSRDVVETASLALEVEDARVARETAEQCLANVITLLTDTLLIDEPASREKLDELRVARDAAVAEHERLSRLASPIVSVSTADWPLLTHDERRDVISAVVARAVVTPGRGPGRIVVESALAS